MLFKFGREVQRIPVSDPFNQCLDWQFRLPAQQFRGGPHPAFDQQPVRRRMEVTAKQAGQVGRRTPVELRHLLYGMFLVQRLFQMGFQFQQRPGRLFGLHRGCKIGEQLKRKPGILQKGFRRIASLQCVQMPEDAVNWAMVDSENHVQLCKPAFFKQRRQQRTEDAERLFFAERGRPHQKFSLHARLHQKQFPCFQGIRLTPLPHEKGALPHVFHREKWCVNPSETGVRQQMNLSGQAGVKQVFPGVFIKQ